MMSQLTARVRVAVAAVAITAFLTPLTIAQPDLADNAAAAARRGDWPSAVTAYEQVLGVNPYRGEHWHNYGYALHSLGKYDQAIAAFTKSIDLGFQPKTSMYNVACGHALSGRTNDALTWLAKAYDHGFAPEDNLIEGDGDLDSLRNDPRFNKIVGIFPPVDLTRDDGWRYDLDFFATRMEQVHYDLYGVTSRENFAQAVADLKSNVPSLEDHEIVVGLQRLTAMAGDGHTGIRPRHDGRFVARRYPLDLYDYSDGLYVQAAAPELAETVGCKVISIGNASTQEAYDAITQICSVDNPMGIKAWAPRYFVIPEVLHALGLIQDMENTTLTLQKPSGEQFTIDLTPISGGPLSETVTARADAEAPAPLYLSHGDEMYWFEYLEDEKLVYFQYNSVRNKATDPIWMFTKKLFEFIEANPVEYLVIDMRRNGGGNNFLNEPIVHGLIKCEKINKDGHLFVIAGRYTFSAAMNCAADIEYHTKAMFVGEPTGSKPNFIGETTMITLPWSGLHVSCSSLYWQRSHAFDYRTWIAPDLVAELSSEDYRTNRDPALEAIFEYIHEQEQRPGR